MVSVGLIIPPTRPLRLEIEIIQAPFMYPICRDQAEAKKGQKQTYYSQRQPQSTTMVLGAAAF